MIFEAIKNNSLDDLIKAIEGGESVNCLEKFHRSPLHKAVMKKSIEMSEYLISKGADVNAIDKAGASILHKAVITKDINLIQLVIKSGAALNSDNGLRCTAWYSAIETPKIADVLVETKDAIRIQLTDKEQEIIESILYSEKSNISNFSLLNTAVLLHGYSSQYNWGDGEDQLIKVINHPLCSKATAFILYDLSSPEYYQQYTSAEAVPDYEVSGYKLVKLIERKYPNVKR